MILKALSDYYDRMINDPSRDIAPMGFERKPIPFVLILNKNGNVIDIKDTRTKKGKSSSARVFRVPQGEKKSSGIKANLLWDSPQYVLGVSKEENEKNIARAQDSLEAFVKKLGETFCEGFKDEGIDAVKRFFKIRPFNDVFNHELWPEIFDSNANMTFMLQGEERLIAQRPEVIRKIIEKSKDLTNAQVCSLSGDFDEPAELHTAIKGVWGGQSSGANIVSFNLSAFCSFGKTQGLNAPIGRKKMFAYTTALNTMLESGSKQRMQIGDTSTVFWTTESHPFEDEFSAFLGEPVKGEEPDYGKIRSLIAAVKTGVLPPEDNTKFFVLGLAPNAARIAIRFWYEGDVQDMKQKIVQHFEDIEIVRSSYDREFLSLFQLLVSTATEGKADKIPPNLGGEVARAVMYGTVYPRTILSGAIRRCKAEQRVTHARASLIKGFLVRDARLKKTTKSEVNMKLDKENENIGYLLGRLFSVLERIQEEAHSTKLNKTIRDSYFSAATSNPVVTFKRLQDLAVHHLAKIKNAGKSSNWLDILMQEVISKIPSNGIPTSLTLEDQGRFAIGYYHQRQDFFTKKNN